MGLAGAIFAAYHFTRGQLWRGFVMACICSTAFWYGAAVTFAMQNTRLRSSFVEAPQDVFDYAINDIARRMTLNESRLTELAERGSERDVSIAKLEQSTGEMLYWGRGEASALGLLLAFLIRERFFRRHGSVA